MFCKTCGEIMVFGPRGCACTRAVQDEIHRRELDKLRRELSVLGLRLFDGDEKPDQP